MSTADEAMRYMLSNLPPTTKDAARRFIGLLDLDTPLWLNTHFQPIANRYANPVGALASMRDELQRIADGPFGKEGKGRHFDGDESVLFYKRDGRICPPEIWAAHNGPPDVPSRGGVYIRVWPKHPHVHWHRRHVVSALAALEHVDENGVHFITTDDVVAAFGIKDSPGVNARAKGSRRVLRDPAFVSLGNHRWANISTLPPAWQESIAQTFARMTFDFDLDLVARITHALTGEYHSRVKAEREPLTKPPVKKPTA